MGCDIHATLEYDWNSNKKKTGNEKWWRAFARDLDIDRNYQLFTILAGVRDTGIRPVIAYNRGVPEDASWEYKDDSEEYGVDGHSHSWVTFDELKNWGVEVKDSYPSNPEEFRNDDWYKTMEVLADRYGDQNVRLCFYFDN